MSVIGTTQDERDEMIHAAKDEVQCHGLAHP